jgi:hypothetical protein
MEKLSKELRKYLYEISPYAGKIGYLPARYRGVAYDEAARHFNMINALSDKDMIYISEQVTELKYKTDLLKSVVMPAAVVVDDRDTFTVKFPFPAVFWLTSDGENYRKEARKETALWLLGALITAIFAGFFAAAFTIVIR